MAEVLERQRQYEAWKLQQREQQQREWREREKTLEETRGRVASGLGLEAEVGRCTLLGHLDSLIVS
jgi:hypothetical protein